MTVTFIQPTTGGVTGPGFAIEVTSDFIGAMSAPFWRIRLMDLDEGYAALDVTTVPLPGAGHTGFVIATPAAGTNYIQPRSSLLPHLGNGHLVAELDSGAGIVDSGTITVQADLVSGALYNLQQDINARQAGLTAEEHTAVLGTSSVVTASLAPWLDDFAQLLFNFIYRPPLAVGGLSSPPYELEGDGQLPTLGFLDPFRFGLHWLATVIPAGLGHLHGNTEEYQQRLVQFRTIHTVGGVDVVSEIFDANWHGGLWVWAEPKPTRVEYSILPGVHLQVRWWQFP